MAPTPGVTVKMPSTKFPGMAIGTESRSRPLTEKAGLKKYSAPNPSCAPKPTSKLVLPAMEKKPPRWKNGRSASAGVRNK